ncbi:RelA/SpoT domain-containing protein [Streptomyces sp. NPDC021622]|uniref:RelA/SpoT domain-containing protein n=1 Tax=Streptomyces sp. NPDC021622 TaxID=3155013 RepID=UPI003411DED5
MVLPFSKSQIERLGRRLVDQSPPAQADLDDLAALLGAYDEVLDAASSEVRDLGYAPTGRLKNTGTILEKLRRHGGTWLKSIQDLAGLRVVIEGGLRAQDQVAEEVMQRFSGCAKTPKLIDRREDPRQGYRAVHVIVFPDGVPVEVQVRTRFQHNWAEVFEKLADLVGREIRYGEEWWLPGEREVPQLLGLSPEADPPLKRTIEAISFTKKNVNTLIKLLLEMSANVAELEDLLTDPLTPPKRAEALKATMGEHLDEARSVIEGVEVSITGYKTLEREARSLAERFGRVRSEHD